MMNLFDEYLIELDVRGGVAPRRRAARGASHDLAAGGAGTG
jgi:hypothetical protein